MPVDLAKMNEEYEKAKPATDGLPPGTYQARIDEAILGTTNDDKYWMIKFKLKVVSGQHEGATAFFNITITGEKDNYTYVKRDLHKLGYSGPLGEDQIRAACEEWIGQYIEIKVGTRKDKRTGEERSQTYMNKRIEPSNITPGYDGPSEPTDYAPPDWDDNI